MAKQTEEIPIYKLAYLQQVFLLTSAHPGGKDPHVIPQIWAMQASFKPEMIVISVANARYTHTLIAKTKEFVLNIPSADMAQKVWACAPPGEGVDKFTRAGLTIMKASKVKAPIVKECLGAIECKVVKKIDMLDHTLFLAKVVATHKMRSGSIMINAPGKHEFKI